MDRRFVPVLLLVVVLQFSLLHVVRGGACGKLECTPKNCADCLKGITCEWNPTRKKCRVERYAERYENDMIWQGGGKINDVETFCKTLEEDQSHASEEAGTESSDKIPYRYNASSYPQPNRRTAKEYTKPKKAEEAEAERKREEEEERKRKAEELEAERREEEERQRKAEEAEAERKREEEEERKRKAEELEAERREEEERQRKERRKAEIRKEEDEKHREERRKAERRKVEAEEDRLSRLREEEALRLVRVQKADNRNRDHSKRKEMAKFVDDGHSFLRRAVTKPDFTMLESFLGDCLTALYNKPHANNCGNIVAQSKTTPNARRYYTLFLEGLHLLRLHRLGLFHTLGDLYLRGLPIAMLYYNKFSDSEAKVKPGRACISDLDCIYGTTDFLVCDMIQKRCLDASQSLVSETAILARKYSWYDMNDKVRERAEPYDLRQLELRGVLSEANKVQDQGSCGSCWAHALTSALSQRAFRVTGGVNNVLYSRQQVSVLGLKGDQPRVHGARKRYVPLADRSDYTRDRVSKPERWFFSQGAATSRIIKYVREVPLWPDECIKYRCEQAHDAEKIARAFLADLRVSSERRKDKKQSAMHSSNTSLRKAVQRWKMSRAGFKGFFKMDDALGVKPVCLEDKDLYIRGEADKLEPLFERDEIDMYDTYRLRDDRTDAVVRKLGTVDFAINPEEAEAALMDLVRREGSVLVSMDGGLSRQAKYAMRDGVFHPRIYFPKITHKVLLMGWGTTNKEGIDYWLFQNSWGKDWNGDGYFKALRGPAEANQPYLDFFVAHAFCHHGYFDTDLLTSVTLIDEPRFQANWQELESVCAAKSGFGYPCIHGYRLKDCSCNCHPPWNGPACDTCQLDCGRVYHEESQALTDDLLDRPGVPSGSSGSCACVCDQGYYGERCEEQYVIHGELFPVRRGKAGLHIRYNHVHASRYNYMDSFEITLSSRRSQLGWYQNIIKVLPTEDKSGSKSVVSSGQTTSRPTRTRRRDTGLYEDQWDLTFPIYVDPGVRQDTLLIQAVYKKFLGYDEFHRSKGYMHYTAVWFTPQDELDPQYLKNVLIGGGATDLVKPWFSFN